MKTFIYSLLTASLFLIATNANALRQEPQKTRNPYMVTFEGDTVQLFVAEQIMRKYDVESDLRVDSSAMSAQGDLYRLTQNIYAAFLLYKTGDTKTRKHKNGYIIGNDGSAWDSRTYYADSLKNIPIEAVESIEVISDSRIESMVDWGPMAETCVIRIKLNDEDLYRASSWGRKY